MMVSIAQTAIIRNAATIRFGDDVIVMDYAVIGLANHYQDIFSMPSQRAVTIGSRCRVYPWVLIYEGATLGDDVIMEERTTVGSLTTIGARSRILYNAQVHDNIRIGEDSIIAGFVADNTSVGRGCSIFGALIHRYSSTDTKAWDSVDEIGPTIEDDVVVGWGAVVVGPVTLRTGTRVLPNSVVRRDVLQGGRYGRRR